MHKPITELVGIKSRVCLKCSFEIKFFFYAMHILRLNSSINIGGINDELYEEYFFSYIWLIWISLGADIFSSHINVINVFKLFIHNILY